MKNVKKTFITYMKRTAYRHRAASQTASINYSAQQTERRAVETMVDN